MQNFICGRQVSACLCALGKRMELKISWTAKLTNQIGPYIPICSTNIIYGHMFVPLT